MWKEYKVMKVKKITYIIIITLIVFVGIALYVRQSDIKELQEAGYEGIGSGFYVRSNDELMQSFAPGIFPKTYAMNINGPALEEYEISGIWIGKENFWSKTEYGVNLPNGKLCMVDESFTKLTNDADIECKEKDIFVNENTSAYKIIYDYYENNPYNQLKKEI